MKPPSNVHKAINDEIRNKLQAQHDYLGMSAHFADSPYSGLAKWMRMQSAEEHIHAMELVDCLRQRNVAVALSATDAPKTKYGSQPLQVFEIVLAQEQGVTRQNNDLFALALKEKDYSTLQFLTWFQQGQAEEENVGSDIIDRLHLAGDNAAARLRRDDEASARAQMSAAKPG